MWRGDCAVGRLMVRCATYKRSTVWILTNFYKRFCWKFAVAFCVFATALNRRYNHDCDLFQSKSRSLARGRRFFCLCCFIAWWKTLWYIWCTCLQDFYSSPHQCKFTHDHQVRGCTWPETCVKIEPSTDAFCWTKMLPNNTQKFITRSLSSCIFWRTCNLYCCC